MCVGGSGCGGGGMCVGGEWVWRGRCVCVGGVGVEGEVGGWTRYNNICQYNRLTTAVNQPNYTFIQLTITRKGGIR